LLDIRKHFSDNCGQTGVRLLKSTYLQFSRCYIFASFGNKVYIRRRTGVESLNW